MTLSGSPTATFEDRNVGNNKTVTVTGYGLTGTAAGNYTLTQPTLLQANITARALAVTATAQNKVYDGTTNASVTLNTNQLDNDLITTAFTSATFADKNVGTKTVTISGITIEGRDAGNYSLSTTTATTTATITASPLTLTGATAANRVYDGTNVVDIAGTLKDAIATDDISLTGKGTIASKNVGARAVTSIGLTGADATNYTLAPPANLTATISAKELTLSNASTRAREYDGTADVVITGTLEGIIPPDAVIVGNGILASKNVGTHAVTSIALTGADAANYILPVPAGLSATIHPKGLTVTVTSQDRIYDGTNQASVTLSINKLPGDDVEADYASAIFENKKAGENKIVTVTGITLSGPDMENYTLLGITSLTSTASINKKQLSITGLSAEDRVYNKTVLASLKGAPSLNGVIEVGGVRDDVSLNTAATVTASFQDKNVGTDKPVNVVGYALTGDDQDNYELSQPTGLSADITPLEVMIADAAAEDKTYDASRDATITGTLVGVIFGDNTTLTKSGTFASRDVGTHIVTSTSVLAGTDRENYTLTQPTGLTARITARELTIANAAASDKVYDGTVAATITGTLSGVMPSDVRNVSLSRTGIFDTKNVGTNIAVTSTVTLTGSEAHNYTLSQPSGLRANITARVLTLTNIAADDKVYDRTTIAAISGTLTGVLPGETVTWSGTGTFASALVNRQNRNTPILAISVTYNTGSLAGADASNYSLASFTATNLSARITPRVLTPVVTSVEKEYDGTTLFTSTAGNLIGVVSPDHVTLYINSQTSVVTDGTQVLNLSIGSSDQNNYNLFPTTATVIVKITPKPLTVTAPSLTKVYDGNDTAPVTLLDNRITGDVLTVTHTSAKFDNKNVGTGKPITIEGLTITGTAASNYSLQSSTAQTTGSITPRPLTITGISADGKEYDGTTDVLGFSGTAVLSNQIQGDDISFSGTPVGTFASKNAGRRAVTVRGFAKGGNDAENYNFTQPAGLTAEISPKRVTGSFKAENKVYDGTTTATVTTDSRTVVGRVANDAVFLEGGTATFEDATPGPDKEVTLKDAILTGTDKANYLLTGMATTLANIDPAPLPVTLTSFTAKAEKGGVSLNWTTAAEKDNDYFQVERSLDGRSFSTMGKVKGNGTSLMLQHYSFQDVATPAGTLYYRLKQVDFDGKFEYSKTIAVETKTIAVSKVTLKAYPNPTTDVVNLDLTQITASDVHIGVYSLNGRLVKTLTVTGGAIQKVDLAGAAIGTYLLRIAGEGFQTTLRVMKQ